MDAEPGVYRIISEDGALVRDGKDKTSNALAKLDLPAGTKKGWRRWEHYSLKLAAHPASARQLAHSVAEAIRTPACSPTCAGGARACAANACPANVSVYSKNE